MSVLIVVAAGLLYLGARETPVFAVRTIDVQGVRPSVARRVETALSPLEGTSLLKLRSGEVDRLATALPSIASVSYDRAFPNTLRVRVTEEQPVAVVRRGIDAWLVSRRGRVIKRDRAGDTQRAPARLAASARRDFAGATTRGRRRARTRSRCSTPSRERSWRGRVGSVHNEAGQWIYVLRGGLQVRVGNT